MGCASSTPMVATAGSEMLKAASHVKQKGEAVVEGVCACALVCVCVCVCYQSVLAISLSVGQQMTFRSVQSKGSCKLAVGVYLIFRADT